VTLAATNGGTTLFQNNVANGATPNSLAFANLQGGTSVADAVLNIDAASGGTVALYDPIAVDMDNSQTFTLNVTGAGDFLWGGANTINVDPGANAIKLNAGTSELLNGFSLIAPNVDFEVNSGATLIAGTPGTAMTVNSLWVDTGATLNFYLPGNQTAAAIGTMLEVTGTVTLNGPAVSVGIRGGSSPLAVGDTITLIDASAGLGGMTANASSHGEGLQGLVLRYGFDLSLTPNQLLATVNDVGLNPRTKALSEARAAALGFLNKGQDWLADHGYDAANAQFRSRGLGWSSAAFGGISGVNERINTGSHVDIDGATLLVGVAARNIQP
jgi:hypothetical protein